MANVARDYEKIGKRNKKKDDLHLNKHAMHLVRLFMMALDILENESLIDILGVLCVCGSWFVSGGLVICAE